MTGAQKTVLPRPSTPSTQNLVNSSRIRALTLQQHQPRQLCSYGIQERSRRILHFVCSWDRRYHRVNAEQNRLNGIQIQLVDLRMIYSKYCDGQHVLRKRGAFQGREIGKFTVSLRSHRHTFQSYTRSHIENKSHVQGCR